VVKTRRCSWIGQLTLLTLKLVRNRTARFLSQDFGALSVVFKSAPRVRIGTRVRMERATARMEASMKTRNLTAIVLSAAFACAIILGSADRAEAHRGWGWGIGAGIASALILGGIYHHRHHYGYYYGGYPYYSYGYYPVYRYRYYRPYWGYHHYYHRYGRRHHWRHW
jgi:hypothetical protein